MIYGIIGGMSSGKTLVMSKLLHNDYSIKKRRIFSNYRLNFPHEIITPEDIESYAKQEQELDNVSVGLDEIYLYIDSRMSSRKSNIMYSYFALQTSKRNVNLYYSAQNIHTVDKRIRDNTHVIIQTFPVIIKKKKPEKSNKLLNLSDYDIVPFLNSEDRLIPGEYRDSFYILLVKVRRLSFGFRSFISTEKELIKASEIFELYDTREIINFSQGKKPAEKIIPLKRKLKKSESLIL